MQPYPADHNYNDEQHRFGQVARLWDRIHPRGSKEWNDLIDELVERAFTLDPTMTIYSAGRDVMRARNADWHEKYTLPSLWDFYQPSRAEPRLVLVLLDDGRRGGLEELLPGVDGVPERLQEHGRPRHHRLGLGLHLQALRLRLHPGVELLQEAGIPSARSHALGDLYGAEALHEPKGKADRVRRHPAGAARRSGDRRPEPAARTSRSSTARAR